MSWSSVYEEVKYMLISYLTWRSRCRWWWAMLKNRNRLGYCITIAKLLLYYWVHYTTLLLYIHSNISFVYEVQVYTWISFLLYLTLYFTNLPSSLPSLIPTPTYHSLIPRYTHPIHICSLSTIWPRCSAPAWSCTTWHRETSLTSRASSRNWRRLVSE